MDKAWVPSAWGRLFTGSRKWALRLREQELELVIDGRVHRAPIDEGVTLKVSRGRFWTGLVLHPGLAHEERVGGLPNGQAQTLLEQLRVVRLAQERQQALALLTEAYLAIRHWLGQVSATIRQAEEERRWVSTEVQDALRRARPDFDGRRLSSAMQDAWVRDRLPDDPATVEKGLGLWESDWTANWSRANEAHVRRELQACGEFFASIESQPLTEEQARAVVCFDNRVQVVAAAGSGKTSTMVAKAAYAIHRGFVAPERIVLLAFNKQAAEELRERVEQSFRRLGMAGTAIRTSTFHALGLDIIGKATGRKPDVPDWAIDPAAGSRRLAGIIDQLKDGSEPFRTRWDLFRQVFARELPAFGAAAPADAWDAQGNGYLRTLRGEKVRSDEERMIANWLFYNGVDYRYEQPYEHDTASGSHRQYRPDFYYPQADLYHEHFALDAAGRAPPQFTGYLEGVAWKRQLHKDMGTELIETSSHLLRRGDWMAHLAGALAGRGIVLDPNPDRPIPEGGRKPMENAELVGLVRTFISHAKSNCLDGATLQQRLQALPEHACSLRHQLFLELVMPVQQAWDAALAAEGGIDFEDMLNLAAEHLEKGHHDASYELVMADEFQDASRARARLCRAMVQKPGRHFFAVGDDWQSINRFAGADVSVMTDFRTWFGHGQVLKLEQTFRCPQALCDVSSRFVAKNPAQLAKQVRSFTPAVGPVLQAFQADREEKLPNAIACFLEELCQGLREASIPPGRNGRVSVFVLGRYHADRDCLPQRWQSKYGRWLDIAFLTMHRAKGSEADYVILPAMLSRQRGRSFPNARADDPVLALAMPGGDSFALGEERRLFYVALTRARRSVAMFTVKGQQSTFLDELVQEHAVIVTDTEGEAIEEQRCPVCRQGVIVTRNGRYGEFQACSNFPSCEYKPGRRAAGAAAASGRPMHGRPADVRERASGTAAWRS